MAKKQSSKVSMTTQMKGWGKSEIGITQLLKETNRDYFKLKKLKKVM
jgi:hypothetical protein